jgi:hypothetical protein
MVAYTDENAQRMNLELLKFLSVDFSSVSQLQDKDSVVMNVKKNAVISDSKSETSQFGTFQGIGKCDRVFLSKIKFKLLDDSFLNLFMEFC